MIYLISTVRNMKNRDLSIILKKKQIFEESYEDTISRVKKITESAQKQHICIYRNNNFNVFSSDTIPLIRVIENIKGWN